MAVRLGAAAGLRNAATAEFLRGPDGGFAFLEVNTRLQVEHGVTELVTGLDLVREQLRLAAGLPLSEAALAAAERAAEPHGHAIEVRIAAENPAVNFTPTPGRITLWTMPAGPGVRVDSGVGQGDRVAPEYDNLIAKLMVHAADRDAAIDRLRRALDETEIGGVQTTLPFHRFVARDESFRDGAVSTGWVGEHYDGPAELRRALRVAKLAAGLEAAGRPGQPTARANRRRSVGGRPLARDRASRCHGPVAQVTADAVRVSSPGCDPAVGEGPLVVEPDTSEARLEWTAPDEAVLVEGATRTRVRFVTAGGRRELLVDGWRLDVAVESERRAVLREKARRGGAVAAHGGPTEVRAIIPGRVVSVSVVPGRRGRRGPAAPRRGGHEDAERAPGAAGRNRRERGRRRRPDDRGRRRAPGARVSDGPKRPIGEGRGRGPRSLAGDPQGEGSGLGAGAARALRDLVGDRDPRPVHARRHRRPGRGPRPRPARRVPVHARRPADDVPRPAVDDAPVRRLRHRRGDQPAVPLPARAGPDRPVGRVRPADPDGLRLRRTPGRRGGGPGRRADRQPRRHGARSLDGLPLGEVTTSMTINATAAILLALYVAVAEAQGVPRDRISGTIQNDILKEYIARGTYIYPPRRRCGS